VPLASQPGSADRPLRDTATHRPMRPCRLSPLPPRPRPRPRPRRELVLVGCRAPSLFIDRHHSGSGTRNNGLSLCVTSVGLAERIAIDRSIESKILQRASDSVSPSVSASFLPASSSAAQAGGPGSGQSRRGTVVIAAAVAVVTDSVPVSRGRDAAS
jgi:hypothetical protein